MIEFTWIAKEVMMKSPSKGIKQLWHKRESLHKKKSMVNGEGQRAGIKSRGRSLVELCMGLCWSSAVPHIHKRPGKRVNREMAMFADGMKLFRAVRPRADWNCRRT